MDDITTVRVSSTNDFQLRVGDESLNKHVDPTQPVPTLLSPASVLKRPALPSRYSAAQSSILSSAHSRDFDELSRLSSVADLRDFGSPEGPLSPATPSVNGDELFRLKEDAREDDQSHPTSQVLEPEQSASELEPVSPTDLEEAQVISHIHATEQPRTLDLKKQSILRSPIEGVGRSRQEVESDDDSINVIEAHGPTVVVHAPSTQPTKFSDPIEYYEAASQGLIQCVTTVTPKVRLEVTDELRTAGRRKLLAQKYTLQAVQVSINGVFIFITWWWMRYYYILLPFIMATVALNVIMILSIMARQAKNLVLPERKVIPETPESMVMIIPCYNETKQELLNSLDCLVAQEGLDAHKKAILIICDGKARGPGMEKTTAHYLLEEILTDRIERKKVRGAYVAWDQQFMDVVVQTGKYGGIPYICVVKQQNQGKRDGLILVRSFLYKFNLRAQKPTVIASSSFFAEMTKFLLKAGFDRVDCVIGMDADTRFEPDCVKNLIDESHYPKTVGVCGYVMVDFSAGRWSLWRLYQSAEYTIAQGLRRLHQSLVTKKVSCLPGCCQLLKICEEACGDEVLIDKFGYCPTVKDGMLAHIRATASEDRNHVCHMLSARPESETRQALKARAVTDVPHSWSVFLSQRRRWTLGATSNDLMLITAPGVQWFERILALVNVWTWYLSPFIIASLVSFVWAILHAPLYILMAFVSVMLVPIVWYLAMPWWITKSWRERLQFYLGLTMFVFCGPFLAIIVLTYALWNMDSFGWGKTRKVISTDDSVDEVGSELNLSETASQVSKEGVRAQEPEVRIVDRMSEAAQEEKIVGARG